MTSQGKDAWNWSRLLTLWREVVGPLPEPLVHRFSLFAPYAVPLSLATWWPRGGERARWFSLQQYILERPNCDPILWLPRQPAGEQTTAEYLSSATNSEELAGTLICAVLWPFMKEARLYPHGVGPNRHLFLEIDEWARQAANLPESPWHHASRAVLPQVSSEHHFGRSGVLDYRRDAAQIVTAIARHNKALLNAWRPVELVADEDGDRRLMQVLQERMAEQNAERDRKHQEWLRAHEAQQAEQARRAEEHQRLHPRAAEWPPSAEVLRELVWSMPTIEVANQFGVSDVAVGKLCRRLKVEKPSRGFWRKVEAGVLPHPSGKSPRSSNVQGG